MANFTNANLVKYQAKVTKMFQSGELRFRDPAVFNFMRRSTEIMVPSHNEIKNAKKRTDGEINYFNRQSRDLGTGGETYDHSGTKGDSGKLIPSWAVYDDKFYYSLKQANNSIFSLGDEIMNEMINLNANFAEGMESKAAAWLHANRSGVNVATREGTFNDSNDVFEITEDLVNITSSGNRAIQITKSIMDINKWRGVPMTIICDTLAFNKFEMLAAQGGANSNNLSFQFSGVEFIKSVELDALAVDLGYSNGYWIAVPMGTVATLEWIPVQNRQGISTKVNKYGSLVHPSTGLLLGTHEYEKRANESDNNSENQDVKFEMQAFDYISFNHAPLSVANETPLQAFGFVENVEA